MKSEVGKGVLGDVPEGREDSEKQKRLPPPHSHERASRKKNGHVREHEKRGGLACARVGGGHQP